MSIDVYYMGVQLSSVAQSCLTFVTPWTAAHQASLSIRTPGVYSDSSPSSWWCNPTISSCLPLLLQPSVFASIRVFSSESVLHIRCPKYWSFSFSIRTEFPLDGLVGSPCSPRDSQESSSTLHFKSINSLVCSFLYSPTLTYIHDHWKNHSFDETD